METLERILRNNIVQQIKTIKLPNSPNVQIESPEVFSVLPKPKIGMVTFIGSDLEIEIHATSDTIEYYSSVDHSEPKLVLRHNVHGSVEMNLKSICESLKSLIKISENSNLLEE